MDKKKQVPVRQHMRTAQPSARTSRHHSLQATIEHHVIVLLLGAAIGSWATYQVTSHYDAKAQAAAQNALKAATPATAVANAPKN
jgi:hypothetical protein